MQLNKVMVLNTRPEPMGQQMQLLFAENDISSLYYPTIINQASKDVNINIHSLLTDANTHWIFISQSAVLFFQQFLQQKTIDHFQPVGPVFAIGPSTERSLLDINTELPITTATRADSESLLELDDLCQAEKVVIVKGRGGRGLIKQTLQNIDIDVVELDLYERVPASYPPEDIISWLDCRIILATSVDVANAVLTQCQTSLTKSQYNQILTDKHWIVLSDRIKQFLIQERVNIDKIIVCEQANNTAIIKAIRSVIGE